MLRGVSTRMEYAHIMGKEIVVSPFFDSIPDISVTAKLCLLSFSGYNGIDQKECEGKGCCWKESNKKVS